MTIPELDRHALRQSRRSGSAWPTHKARRRNKMRRRATRERKPA